MQGMAEVDVYTQDLFPITPLGMYGSNAQQLCAQAERDNGSSYHFFA